MITINSGAQIHPLIATRWSSSLKGKSLRYIMVANHGYLPDKVNFAARIAKNRVNPEIPVDLIASFKAAAATDPGDASLSFASQQRYALDHTPKKAANRKFDKLHAGLPISTTAAFA